MAIISNETDERGYVFENQYIKVESVRVTKTTMNIEVGVRFKAEDELPHRVHNVEGEFDLESDKNVWEQAYVFIKQRWTDSQDV